MSRFDQFFDCLNVSSPNEHVKKCEPYTSCTNERLFVSLVHICTARCVTNTVIFISGLKRDFLGYLDEWERRVNARDDIRNADKAKLMHSKETVEGLHITG